MELLLTALAMFGVLCYLRRVPAPFRGQFRLGSLLVPDVGEVRLLARCLYGSGGLITGATNASPTVLTSAGHGLSNGDGIYIANVGGNTNCNGGPFVVNNVAANTFQIASISGTTLTLINGNGAYTSGGSWSLAGVQTSTLKLFKNNITPAEGDTASTYTEATFTGYAAVDLTSQQATANWPAPSTNTGTTSSTYGTAAVFSATSVETEYGYFVIEKTSTIVLWSELFASPIGMVNPSTLTITPALQLA
jgi:hypothetical protein